VLTPHLKLKVQTIIVFSLVLTTLLITPWLNLDPINLPKFLVLIMTGFLTLGIIGPNFIFEKRSKLQIPTLASLSFILMLFLVYFSHPDSPNQLFGTFGRNTGLLSYISLTLLFWGVICVSTLDFFSKILYALVFTGVINSFYGLIQWLNLDPVFWNNIYNPIIGTLGNSNFISAHLGMAALAALNLCLGDIKVGTGIFLTLSILLFLFVIFKSESSQGLLISGLGAGITLYFRFFRERLILGSLYISCLITLTLLGILGIFNKGPMSQYIYQDSLSFRGDYWRAAWRMTLDNPFVGIGLDSYGDWYRYYRDEAAALRRGPDVTSNSAHNVFLDISSNGGFLLLLTYMLITGLIFRSVFRVFKRLKTFDSIGVGLVVTWIAYQTQSIISINQLGLAIWGWVLGGAIVGYDFLFESSPINKRNQFQHKERNLLPVNSIFFGCVGLAGGLLLAIWPVVKDASMKSAMERGDATRIIKVSNQFPANNFYLNYTGDFLLSHGLNDQALEVAKKSIEINSQDFDAWKLLSENPNLSVTERSDVLLKMKAIDPYNPNLME